MIVTAHQPNFLPGWNVVRKLGFADAVVWLDEVQFSKGGWTNRNRMPDGSWLTVPVERATDGLPINRVRISEHRLWRARAQETLHQHYGSDAEDLCRELARPYRLLVGLNLALLRVLLDAEPVWHFQSHLDGGHAVRAVSEEREELLPISERLALMVAELGGEVYLSGPSGRRYLDERPFLERGIRVDYYRHEGTTQCAAGLTRKTVVACA